MVGLAVSDCKEERLARPVLPCIGIDGDRFTGDPSRERTIGDDGIGALLGPALGGLAERDDASERVEFTRETPVLKVR